jgi:putative tricarboxylic transport membrane protein
MRLSRDSLTGLICFALSLWMLFLARDLPRNPLVPIGPDFYPRIVLVVMALFSAALIVTDAVSAWRRARIASSAESPPPEKRNYSLVGATFTTFAVYVFLLPLVGFRIATFLFVAALQVILEPPRDSGRRWIIVLLAALTTVIATYFAFEVYLSVLLPRGRWTGF